MNSIVLHSQVCVYSVFYSKTMWISQIRFKSQNYPPCKLISSSAVFFNETVLFPQQGRSTALSDDSASSSIQTQEVSSLPELLQVQSSFLRGKVRLLFSAAPACQKQNRWDELRGPRKLFTTWSAVTYTHKHTCPGKRMPYWIINLQLSQETSPTRSQMGSRVWFPASLWIKITSWIQRKLCHPLNDELICCRGLKHRDCAHRERVDGVGREATPWPAQQAQHGIRTHLRPQAGSVFAQRLTAVCWTACLVVSSHLDS